MKTRAAVLPLALCIGVTAAAEAPGVAYPDGYRRWSHVKTTIVGPSSPAFASNGGIHHFYANDKAMEGYAKGNFPDGAVLIDDGLEAVESNGVTKAGPRKRLAVMVKDAKAAPDTGGWLFEVFPKETHAPSLTQADRASCFACHTKANRGAVFSDPQP
jgi:hypothetical protein